MTQQIVKPRVSRSGAFVRLTREMPFDPSQQEYIWVNASQVTAVVPAHPYVLISTTGGQLTGVLNDIGEIINALNESMER